MELMPHGLCTRPVEAPNLKRMLCMLFTPLLAADSECKLKPRITDCVMCSGYDEDAKDVIAATFSRRQTFVDGIGARPRSIFPCTYC